MIKQINTNKRQRIVLMEKLEEVLEDLTDNDDIIEANKYKSNYLHILNENNKLKIDIEDLLNQLKQNL